MSIMPKDLQASDVYNQLALVSGLSDQQLQQASQNPKYGWMAGIVAANRAEERAPNPPMPQGTVINEKLAQLQGGIPAGMGNQQAMMQGNPMAMGIAAAPENVPGAATGGIIALAHGGQVRGFSGGTSVGSYDPVTGEWRKHPYHESTRSESDPTGQYITEEDIEAGRKHESVKPRYRTLPAEVKDVYGLQGMTPEQASAEIARLNRETKVNRALSASQEGIPEELQRLNEASQLERGGYNKLSDFGDPKEMERLTPNTKGVDYSNLEAGFPPQEAAYPLEQVKVNPTPLMKEKAAKVPTPKIDEAIETAKGKKGKKAKAAPPSGNVEKAPEPAPTPAAEPAAPEQPTWGKTQEQARAEFEAGQGATPPPEDIPLGAKAEARAAGEAAEAVDPWTGEAVGRKGAGVFTPANAALALSETPVGKAGFAGPQIAAGSRSPEAYQNLARGIYAVAHPIDSTVQNVKDFGQGIVGLGRAAMHPVDTASRLYREGAEKVGSLGRTVSENAQELGSDVRDWIQQQSWRDAGAQEPSVYTPPAHDTAHGDKPGQVKADPNAPGFKPTPKVQAHPEAVTPPAQATPTGQPTTPAGGMTVSAPGGITNAGARTTLTPGGIAGSPTDDQQLAWYKHMLGDSAYHAPEALNAEWEKQKENLARDKWGLAAVRGIAGMISAPTEHWGKALGIGLGEAASQYAAGARQEEDFAEKSLARAEADAKADYDFNREAAKLHIAERAAKARDDADLKRAMAVAREGYNTAVAKYNLGAEDKSADLDVKYKNAAISYLKSYLGTDFDNLSLQQQTQKINEVANMLRNNETAASGGRAPAAGGAKYIFDPNMGVRTAG